MRRALRRGVIAALALVAMAAAPAIAATSSPPATAVVGATSPRAAQAVADHLRAEGLRVTTIPHIGALEVSGDALAAVRGLVGHDPRVDWVEPPRDRTLFVVAPPTVDSLTGRTFGWAVDSVDAAAGLAMVPGILPVSVAIVDSGIDVSHPDLAGRIGATYDVLTGGSAVKDLVGHGTFVAGLISAIDGNDLGSHGVAGATTVLPIRITTNGTIKSADSAAGIVRAVDSGAGVVNLSYGGATISDVEKAALAYAAQKDVLVVAAAGNAFQLNNPVQYPAAAIGGVKGSWSAGLSVAATDPLGRHAPFSTANDFVSVAAPGAGSGQCGDGVFSTIPANPTLLWDGDDFSSCTRVVDALGTSTGRYGYAEGTSFAAPLVAGAAALARDANPDLSAEQTADVIRRSAHQTIGSGWNAQTGAGVLDVGAAVALARIYDTSAPVPALTAAPAIGAVSVALAGQDAAGPGALEAGIATYRLERSTDGTAYATVAAAQASAIRFDEALTPGQTRWYRGTVCDANHNCASALSGPVTAATAPPSPPAQVAATLPPAMRTLAAGRPGSCLRCVRVTFAAQGSGPLKWAVALTPRNAGVKPIRRTGLVPAAGRVVVRIPLSRIPSCRGRLAIAMSLTSPFGTSRSTRTLAVQEACRRVARR